MSGESGDIGGVGDAMSRLLARRDIEDADKGLLKPPVLAMPSSTLPPPLVLCPKSNDDLELGERS